MLTFVYANFVRQLCFHCFDVLSLTSSEVLPPGSFLRLSPFLQKGGMPLCASRGFSSPSARLGPAGGLRSLWLLVQCTRARSYPISTLPEHLHSTILRTPKLPENTHKPMETSFHPLLTLVPLLANYPHSHYSPPSLGVPPSHTPF